MRLLVAFVCAAACGGLVGCDEEMEADRTDELGTADQAVLTEVDKGQKLFTKETFGGNGRTCSTCHSAETGSISPENARALFASNPDHPLFRPIDADVNGGSTYERLLTDATVRVFVDLPPNVTLVGDPTARRVELFRAVPSVIDVPALEPVLMFDGRAPDLETQALGAVISHAQPGFLPTARQLDRIAAFEETLFSNESLRLWASGGPPPQLPPGRTLQESRGRLFFEPEDVPLVSELCGGCHGGPMLNTSTIVTELFDGVPFGSRFTTAEVSEFNNAGLPVREYDFVGPDGTVTRVATPDPGRALVTGRVEDVNHFKIPTLWNIKNTAPYFHDNSATTLEEVVDHYNDMFAKHTEGAFQINDVQKADLVAYLKLL